MSDGFDVYSKVVLMGFTGVNAPFNMLDSSNNPTTNKYWYHPDTIRSKSKIKALLAVNTSANGISFNAHCYGELMAGITNYFMLSENIQSGLTSDTAASTNSQPWLLFSSNLPSGDGAAPSGAARWSPIKMPDGSTNGVRVWGLAGATSSGIYQPIRQQNTLPKGKVYTASVWACGDSGGGVYTSTPKFRFSYFTDSPNSVSLLGEEITLSQTPTRYSYTFVSNTNIGVSYDNIALCASYNVGGATTQLVFWGAQLCDGNTENNYIPTNTEWNGRLSSIGVATAGIAGQAAAGSRYIESFPVVVGGSTSVLLNSDIITVSANTSVSYTTPTTLSIYGLY
jgi:hypothetical protein